jgi:hypothetical protein
VVTVRDLEQARLLALQMLDQGGPVGFQVQPAAVARVVADEGPLALLAPEEAFLLQEPDRLAHRHEGDAKLLGQGIQRGKPFARLPPPLPDAPPDQGGDLEIKRALAFRKLGSRN